MADRYTHGHHDSVLRSHRWRTAENSAAYLLPHLQPGSAPPRRGLRARHASPSTSPSGWLRAGCVGIDAAAEVVDGGRADRDERGRRRTSSFAVGDVYALEADDDAVRRRPRPPGAPAPHRPGGRPAGDAAGARARAASSPSARATTAPSTWAPDDPLLDRWLELYHQVTGPTAPTPTPAVTCPAGSGPPGFTDLDRQPAPPGPSPTPDDRAWWGGLWADRVVASAFAGQAVEYGLATPAELDDIAAAFRRWADGRRRRLRGAPRRGAGPSLIRRPTRATLGG